MNYESHPKMKYLYIGVDCHKFIHVTTMINCFNEKIDTITINNDKKGFENLVKKVNEIKENLIPVYGLEDVKHLGYELANYLLTKNEIVKHVNSNLTANERKKNPIIIKNDEVDSECIAKVLLDELFNLPNAQNDEIYWTLKQLVKIRTTIVGNNIEAKNKLHSQLLHHYPNYNQIYCKVDLKSALNFWEKYPSPKELLEEDYDTLISNLKEWSHNNARKVKADKILELVKQFNIEFQEYQEERNFVIRMLVKQIKDNNTRLEEIETEMIKIYDKIGCTLHTYPCMSKVTGACMLSEIGNINRFKDSGKLAKYAGIAPIEKSSGGTDKALKNHFGNRELNSMFYNLACRSICISRNGQTLHNPIFKEYYNKKLEQGKTKHQALICVMRRTCNIIYNMLKNNVEYEPPKKLIEESNNSFRERKKLEEEQLKLKLEKKEKYKKKNQTVSSTVDLTV